MYPWVCFLSTPIAVCLHVHMYVCLISGLWLLFIIISWVMQYEAKHCPTYSCYTSSSIHSHDSEPLAVYHPHLPLTVCFSRCFPPSLPLRLYGSGFSKLSSAGHTTSHNKGGGGLDSLSQCWGSSVWRSWMVKIMLHIWLLCTKVRRMSVQIKTSQGTF